MTNPHLRFSIQMPNAPHLQAWTDKVRRAEDEGFYSVSVPDHLGMDVPQLPQLPQLAQLAPLVALAAAATVTSRVRLATTVLDNDFRHPVMLAKEIATLDLLSNGRVDMGIGAGWLVEDYTRTGIAEWDPPGIRVDRLFEAISLLRQLLAGGPVTFKGHYYQVEAFESYPSPVQQPIPLMLGGGGKRMLSKAAAEAQIVSIMVRHHGDSDARLAAFDEQLRWIQEARSADAHPLIGIRILFGAVGSRGESRQSIAQRVAGAGAGSLLSPEEVASSPFGLVGDLNAIKDHLLALHDRFGLNYFTVSEDLAWEIAPIVGEFVR